MLALLQELHGRRAFVPLRELARKLSVTERQVRRDVEVLATQGYTIDNDIVDGRSALRFTPPRTHEAEPQDPAVRERITLALVSRVFATLESTPFAEDVRRVFPQRTTGDRIATFQRQVTHIPAGGTKRYGARSRDALNELLTGLVYCARLYAADRNPRYGTVLGAGPVSAPGHESPR